MARSKKSSVKTVSRAKTSRRFAVAISRFNDEVTTGLLAGSRAALAKAGSPLRDEDVYWAPGAFELPLLAQELARTGRYAGVICLGCVIKGDTAHFEFISLGTTIGIQQAMLTTRTPIAFGVLTTYSDDQAVSRSRPGASDDIVANKGHEAAAACLELADRLAEIRK